MTAYKVSWRQKNKSYEKNFTISLQLLVLQPSLKLKKENGL